MTARGSAALGRIAYGALFVVVVPALLILWARATANVVRLPAVASPTWGVVVAVAGATLIVAGTFALARYGGGLPMNAFPPPAYVQQGVYAVTLHPIYVGFGMICVGTSIAMGSASGLWLVSPVAIFACVALVEGYERHDLRRRFGGGMPAPFLRVPPPDDAPPTAADRISVYVLLLIPWLILYEGAVTLGVPPDAVSGYLPFEERWPVIVWAELAYAATYPFVILAPLIARRNADLRRFVLQGALATAIIVLCFLVAPLIAPPRPFTSHGPLGAMLAFERANDTPAAAFPSFHVLWALLAAALYAESIPRWRAAWWGAAFLIAASCLATGMHSIVDVIAGTLVFVFVRHATDIWQTLRRTSERIANSWTEWRVGPVRLLNRGLWVGAGAFVVAGTMGILVGPGSALPITIMGLTAIITSAIWAQVVEGSPTLLRPYGWYGGIIGGLLGASIAVAIGADPLLLLAALFVAAPWGQSLGRLGCLVLGCCHGGPAPENVGIRYSLPQSRACRIAHLDGVPIHPTPLYSIIWNVASAPLLLRLWFLHAPLTLIAGTFLILNGLGRFVEESYRAEPQTPVRLGLHLYQWMAVASLLVGIGVTMLPVARRAPTPAFNWPSIFAALAAVAYTAVAFGVDLPESNRRFARLA